jgi:hypothetical protein
MGRELLMLRIKIVIGHDSRQMFGDLKFSLDEGPIDDELRGPIREACYLPGLDLLPHRLEVALHAVHADREDVREAQVLGAWRAQA